MGLQLRRDQWDYSQGGPMGLQPRRTNGITAKEDQWDYSWRGPMGLQPRRTNGITTEEDQWDYSWGGPMALQLRRTNGITAEKDQWDYSTRRTIRWKLTDKCFCPSTFDSWFASINSSILHGMKVYISVYVCEYIWWWWDLNMWVDYRCSLGAVYNDGEISTCG